MTEMTVEQYVITHAIDSTPNAPYLFLVALLALCLGFLAERLNPALTKKFGLFPIFLCSLSVALALIFFGDNFNTVYCRYEAQSLSDSDTFVQFHETRKSACRLEGSNIVNIIENDKSIGLFVPTKLNKL
jgi:hypothetical protein